MIHVDENDPVGEVKLSFPHRDVQIKRGIDPKDVYTLEEEIGRGKFGTVYKCTEKSINLPLAAKFISCPKKEDRRNVEREIEIMRSLQHPRLIQIYDAFENGKVMCVVLELIEGGELFERVIDDDFILTEKSCTIFMRQICDGVNFIHKQRILHLDMKPENVLCLTKTGNRIKIIDFGLARKFDPDKKLQVLFGTPEFVAPEVLNFDTISYATDMWSVGVICYVLLSGLSPFMGHTDIETMNNVTIGKFDFEDEAFEEISENAKDFIRRLLVRDINQRMTAEESLNHKWLAKKPSLPKQLSMDTTKDNLKQFVERWNEHPNSPYVSEVTSNMIPLGGYNLCDSLQSLRGMSPSPCESICSTPEEETEDNSNANNNSNNNNNLDHPIEVEHFRRASDSVMITTASDDITERINLAEEIRKLSDKLFQLSQTDFNHNQTFNNLKTIDADTPNDQLTEGKFVSSFQKAMQKDPEKRLTTINKFETIFPSEQTNFKAIFPHFPDRGNGIEDYNFPKSLQKGENLQSFCTVPWRRTKHKINSMSRDVPLYNNKFQNTFRNPIFVSTTTYKTFLHEQNEPQSPSRTKDLLLKLLEHWDGSPSQRPIRNSIRHNSVSSEWTEHNSLGQRTISSLNSFFQSRSSHKKVTPFHEFETSQIINLDND